MSSAGVATLTPVAADEVPSPSTLHMAPPPDSILVYLSVSGSMIPLRVLESDSIASVKLRIQTCKGFVVKKQRLVFGGRELARNDSLVRDYGVGDGNVLHLVLRMSDLRVITVRTACGRVFEFHVERNRNVGYVKRQIAEKGLDFDGQDLLCDGEVIGDDDCRLIDELFKRNDAVVHLLVRKSAKVRARPVEKDFEISIDAPELEKEPPDGDLWIEPVIVNQKVELPAVVKELIGSVFAGLEMGNLPIQSSEGSGGVYFMLDAMGRKYIAVFKPIDEEPMAENNPRGLPVSLDGEGLKRGTRVGEGALREVAAYLLDHPKSGRRTFLNGDVGFSGVPPTVMVRCSHSGFDSTKNYKIGSLQMFVENEGSCEDMGPRAFPVDEVHKISVLDIRLANADRHGGNILVCRDGEEGRIRLVPIDHGYCLPENFEDCTFEWLYWPQSREPYSQETVDYIRALDAEQDIVLLKLHGWEPSVECCRTLRISTMLLKKGVERGLTPFVIGSILCRETLQKESVIEEIVYEAKEAVLPGTSEATFLEAVSEIMDRRLDELKM
ncbi:Polyubiquitin 8 [Acorus gramineus]|uniref:1-phosphatidylinositol 4-kinase n=1 Tax=Acorus gramineus TaxID=55184 RepID=A0AAV9BHT0_ACOGR|nr:Polyubiquitin 8 [Acorus gramineus]